MKQFLHSDKSNFYYPIIIILLCCLWLASCSCSDKQTVTANDGCVYVMYNEKTETYNGGVTQYTITTKMLHSATCKNPKHYGK